MKRWWFWPAEALIPLPFWPCAIRIAIAFPGLFVDYGQPCAESEWRAVQGVGRHFGISVERVESGFGLVSSKGEYFGRNALLVMIAASVKEVRPLVIGIGIHALSPYYDTTPLFVRHIGRVLDGYSDGSVKLFAPFLGDTKSEVVQLADQLGLPLEATYSCERQDAPACGQCPSCQDREAVK